MAESDYFSSKVTDASTALMQQDGGEWYTIGAQLSMKVSMAGEILAYEGDVRYAKAEKTLNIFDGTSWNAIPFGI